MTADPAGRGAGGAETIRCRNGLGVKPLAAMGRLQQHLRSGEPEGLYVLVGEDTFAREAALQAIEAAAGDPADMDRTLLRADEAGVDAVAVAVGSSSLFGGRRLVVVRDFDRLAAPEQEKLVPLLGAPAPGLIVVVSARSLDGRRKATKSLTAAGHSFNFPVPEGEALHRWVVAHAKTLGVDMSRAAVAALLELVPPEPQMIHTELEKLALFSGGAPVTPAAVKEVASIAVPFAAEKLIFQFTELVVEGKTEAALAALHDMLSVGQIPLVVLTMIGRQYRILATASDPDPGAAKQNLMRLFRQPPFIADQSIRKARAVGRDAIEAGLRRVLAMDEAMKKSQDPRLALEALVVALAQKT